MSTTMMTPEQMMAKIAELQAALAVVEEKVVEEPVSVAVAEEKVVEEPVEEKVAVAEEEKPAPDHYRMDLDDIDSTKCMARVLYQPDLRWSFAVYHEKQCIAKPAAGGDICNGCAANQRAELETGKHKHWNGRITEPPGERVHMLGTSWAEKLKWCPDGKKPSPAKASPAKASPAKEKKVSPSVAEKEEKKAAKAEKEKAKEEKKAEKEAAKKAVKAPKAPKVKEEKVPESMAAVTEAPADGENEMMDIAGTLYIVKKGNVYEWDEALAKPGDFVGRLTEGGEIDGEGEEVMSEGE